jgi:hypothetical protein
LGVAVGSSLCESWLEEQHDRTCSPPAISTHSIACPLARISAHLLWIEEERAQNLQHARSDADHSGSERPHAFTRRLVPNSRRRGGRLAASFLISVACLKSALVIRSSCTVFQPGASSCFCPAPSRPAKQGAQRLCFCEAARPHAAAEVAVFNLQPPAGSLCLLSVACQCVRDRAPPAAQCSIEWLPRLWTRSIARRGVMVPSRTIVTCSKRRGATLAFCAGRREVALRSGATGRGAFCCPVRTISVFTPTKTVL